MYIDFDYTTENRCNSMSLEDYIAAKLRILHRDFKLDLDPEEILHMQSLKSEIAVDNYARDLISKR